MVWLSLSPQDSTTGYVAEHQLPTERVFVGADKALLRAARMRGVPLTLVVDSSGSIQYVHAGAVTQSMVDSIVLVARKSAATAPKDTAS